MVAPLSNPDFYPHVSATPPKCLKDLLRCREPPPQIPEHDHRRVAHKFATATRGITRRLTWLERDIHAAGAADPRLRLRFVPGRQARSRRAESNAKREIGKQRRTSVLRERASPQSTTPHHIFSNDGINTGSNKNSTSPPPPPAVHIYFPKGARYYCQGPNTQKQVRAHTLIGWVADFDWMGTPVRAGDLLVQVVRPRFGRAVLPPAVVRAATATALAHDLVQKPGDGAMAKVMVRGGGWKGGT